MKGKIYTFYSYKGGVGRTMALANVALLLAERGRRVLCIDFDLEASGLHDYFRPLLPEGWKADRGIIDLVDRQDTTWREVVSPLKVDKASGNGRVDLLPSGVEATDFVARLGKLDWEKLYGKEGLGERLEFFRQEWATSYDTILIDSRTGLSDTGGICTVQLPDYIVMVLTANEQSLKGTLDVAERINRARADYPATRSQAPILPLISRFEGSVEKKRSDEWMAKLADRLTPLYSSWLDSRVQPSEILLHTRLPHVGYWSFGEGLPVLEENRKDPFTLAFAYTTLAALIDRELVGTFELVREREEYVAEGAVSVQGVSQRVDFAFLGNVDDYVLDVAGVLRAGGSEVRVWNDDVLPGDSTEDVSKKIASVARVIVHNESNGLYSSEAVGLTKIRSWELAKIIVPLYKNVDHRYGVTGVNKEKIPPSTCAQQLRAVHRREVEREAQEKAKLESAALGISTLAKSLLIPKSK